MHNEAKSEQWPFSIESHVKSSKKEHWASALLVKREADHGPEDDVHFGERILCDGDVPRIYSRQLSRDFSIHREDCNVFSDVLRQQLIQRGAWKWKLIVGGNTGQSASPLLFRLRLRYLFYIEYVCKRNLVRCQVQVIVPHTSKCS